ncbi:hypothetical protein EDD86DRAFT_188772 [Gorgonomyces haynaldii]|nr:hypothetical protein EDD86DRAFT_188772 [Gorgonomyces haynaldii]
MEKDWSEVTDKTLEETKKLAKGNLVKALEDLAALEKQTRLSADLQSNTRVLLQIVNLSYEAKDYKLLNEYVAVLSKKRALLKQAVTKMIQECIKFVEQTSDMTKKLELIDTLRTVTDGKIFVEVERARLTRMLVDIKEKEGNIAEAAELMHALQVETFGSMERREKTDFILEQIRLALAKSDYVRAQIISRKISVKFFEDPQNEDLKIRFYRLMIQHAIYSDHFLKATEHHRQLLNTKAIKEDQVKWRETLTFTVLFIVLSPFDNQQSDLIHRIHQDPSLEQLPLIKGLLESFITPELVRWTKINEIYGPTLKQTTIFDPKTEQGQKRYKTLHQRIVEHNVRVIAKYYSRISMKKLTQLLDLPAQEVEDYISSLVVSKTIYARIDRISGIVSFVSKEDPNTILNKWSQNVSSLLDLIVKTSHLIQKEEMVHSITKVITE